MKRIVYFLLIYIFQGMVPWSPSVAYGQDSLKIINDQVTQRGLFEKGKLTGNIAFQTGRISDFEMLPSGGIDYDQPVKKTRYTLALNLGYNLLEKVYFRMTFYYNLNKDINALWNLTDYSFVLERANWMPNTFSYGYNNYQLNHYSSNIQDLLDNISRGTFYVRYYNRIPNKWIEAIRFDSTASLSYSAQFNYAIKYLNNDNKVEGDLFHGKPTMVFNLRYAFFKNLYVEGSITAYFDQRTRVSYDPDYTYNFGYNSYKHMSIALAYGNYAVNRFPWKEKVVKDYGFLDGIFSVMLNLSF